MLSTLPFHHTLPTEQALSKKALDQHILLGKGNFKIEGSDLEWREEHRHPCGTWFRARCVTPGVDRHGIDYRNYTILTQGTHGYSPFLDLPYVCYFHGNSPADPFSVISRYDVVEDKPSILDLSNPYKPRRLKTEDVLSAIADNGDRSFNITTRYGVLGVKLFDTSDNTRIKVYIPEKEIVATLFRTLDGEIEIQCMFNVGNSFARKATFPVATADGYVRRPMILAKRGMFSKQGTWIGSGDTINNDYICNYNYFDENKDQSNDNSCKETSCSERPEEKPEEKPENCQGGRVIAVLRIQG